MTVMGDFNAFRDAARALVNAGVPPQEIIWHEAGESTLFDQSTGPAPAVGFTVPTAYVRLAEDVICHRDPERFALLYDLLWRLLHGERNLLTIAADPLVHRLERLRKAVGRDVHKMHAFVRFRKVDDDEGPRYVAWFEPDNYILERAAPFFVGRFPAMHWSILTPIGSLHWDGEALLRGDPVGRENAPAEDGLEEWWKTYYRAAFNPARVNPTAMRAEMPKRYWRNLPEAALIPQLLSESAARTRDMLTSEPTQPRKSAARMRPAAANVPVPAVDASGPLDNLDAIAAEAAACTRCDLYKYATQTVFGAGPSAVRLMFVGEQPGDQEDLAGLPFVGPAGQLFDRALAEAGIDRSTVYVTNAVKHFKFEPRGKRRIHQKPDRPEIEACRWWLERELAIIRPELIVALGATAGQAVLGRVVKVMSERGRFTQDHRGNRVLTTVHPSFLLRLPDADAKAREYAAFVEDLRKTA